QQGRQGSLEGLVSALQKSTALPDGLRATVDKLLGLIPNMQTLGDAKVLAQALDRSGGFLEARLLAGQPDALAADLKATLLRMIAQWPGRPGSTPLTAAQAGAAVGQALPAFARDALGMLGQSGARQLALSFPLPGKLLQNPEEEADLEILLKLAAAAVSRL